MSNILIQNRGELPVWGLRLLGLSNKTPDQIGQFGTGLKESIAMLARMGSLPIIYSGECKMDFSVISNGDDPEEIHFRLSRNRGQFTANEWYGLGMHPDFGKADWNDPWMVFREIICNALDESGEEGLVHDVTSKDPSGKAGATRFYIPMTDALLKGYEDAHHRLLCLSGYKDTADRPEVGQAIAKRDQKNLQVFHRGVWVQQSQEDNSINDYHIAALKLNESRSADWHQVMEHVAAIVLKFSQKDIRPLLDSLIVKPDGPQYYEESVLYMTAWHMDKETGTEWAAAFYTKFGPNAVLCADDKFLYDKIQDIGQRPIVCRHTGLMSCLKNAGIPDAEDVLTNDQKDFVKLDEPSDASRDLFDRIWQMFVEADMTNDQIQPSLMIFTPRAGSNKVTFGLYDNGMCKINAECVGSQHERTAMVEEIAHHVTGASDESREFQHFLVESLTKFMFQGVEL